MSPDRTEGPMRNLMRRWAAGLRRVLLGRPRWKPASKEGQRGEVLADRYLRRNRYRVIGRNVRTAAGEADLLCIDPDRTTMVVVEVKSRTLAPGQASAPIPPEASVTREKRQRLQRVARLLARANGWEDRRWRIDVVAVEIPAAGKEIVRHTADLPWL
jgi:putative endonuclease